LNKVLRDGQDYCPFEQKIVTEHDGPCDAYFEPDQR
jgi:hypothetical protein